MVIYKWENNKEKNGEGTVILDDGIYKGIIKDSKKECINGKMIYKNGDIYEGEFKNDKREGNGKMIYKNGDIYEGDDIGKWELR